MEERVPLQGHGCGSWFRMPFIMWIMLSVSSTVFDLLGSQLSPSIRIRRYVASGTMHAKTLLCGVQGLSDTN